MSRNEIITLFILTVLASIAAKGLNKVIFKDE